MNQNSRSPLLNNLAPTILSGLIIIAAVIGISRPRIWLILPVVAVMLSAIYYLVILQKEVRTSRNILIALLVIYAVFLFHGIFNPGSIERIARVLIFIPISFICIFIVPFLVSKEQFLKVLSLIAGLIAILGIPSAFIGDRSPLGSIHGEANVLGTDFYIIQSVLHNPNPLGELLFFGAVASLIWPKGSTVRRGVFLLCTFGLFLSQSRAAFLAITAAISVYVTGSYLNQEHFQQFILFCIGTGTIGYLMLLRLIPGPAVIENIYLSGRLDIWHASIDAIRAKPVLGHGPGDLTQVISEFTTSPVGAGVYGSFLRLFVTTGIVGGVCYLYVFAYTIIHNSKQICDHEHLILFSLLIGFVVNELFSGNSIFGLSATSLISAIILGYLLVEVWKN